MQIVDSIADFLYYNLIKLIDFILYEKFCKKKHDASIYVCLVGIEFFLEK